MQYDASTLTISELGHPSGFAPTSMRTRSGLVIGRGDSDEISLSMMAEDNYSTEAQWGTPLGTSYSTTDSIHASNQPAEEYGPEAQPNQHGRPIPGYEAEDQIDNAMYAPQEPLSSWTRQERTNDFLQHQGAQHHYEQPYASNDYGAPPQPEPESLRRFSSEASPWSPASPVIGPSGSKNPKRKFPGIPAMDNFALDRNYPDQLEVELNELSRGDESEHDDGHKKKKKKSKKDREGGSGTRRPRRSERRRKDGDGNGEGGGAMGIAI